MAKEYVLSTVSDFLAVPEESLEACLQDFLVWLRVARNAKQIDADMQTFFNTNDGDVTFDQAAFIWIDDGMTGVSAIHYMHQETGETIRRVPLPAPHPEQEK